MALLSVHSGRARRVRRRARCEQHALLRRVRCSPWMGFISPGSSASLRLLPSWRLGRLCRSSSGAAGARATSASLFCVLLPPVSPILFHPRTCRLALSSGHLPHVPHDRLHASSTLTTAVLLANVAQGRDGTSDLPELRFEDPFLLPKRRHYILKIRYSHCERGPPSPTRGFASPNAVPYHTFLERFLDVVAASMVVR